MTQPVTNSAFGTDPDALSLLGADVLELIRKAAASGWVAGIVTESSGTCPREALRRLALGRALHGDEALLGFPVVGSRLVHVTATPIHTDRLAAALEGDSDVVAAVAPGDLVMLVRDVPRAADDDRGLRDARRQATRVHRIVTGAAVGISNPITSVQSLPSAAEEAADAAHLARSEGVPTLECDQQWAALALIRVRRRLGQTLSRLEPLERLRAYDERHRSDLARTVAAWLQNNQDTGRTARELSLHPNSLRYRLRRATEVSGLDLDDPEQRIVVQLALG